MSLGAEKNGLRSGVGRTQKRKGMRKWDGQLQRRVHFGGWRVKLLKFLCQKKMIITPIIKENFTSFDSVLCNWGTDKLGEVRRNIFGHWTFYKNCEEKEPTSMC